MLSALCFHNRIASGSLQWPDWSCHRRCGNCCFKEKYSRYIRTEVRARDNALAAGWGQSLIVNNSAFLLRLNDTDTTANMNMSFNAHLTFTVAPVYAAFILFYYLYLPSCLEHSQLSRCYFGENFYTRKYIPNHFLNTFSRLSV